MQRRPGQGGLASSGVRRLAGAAGAGSARSDVIVEVNGQSIAGRPADARPRKIKGQRRHQGHAGVVTQHGEDAPRSTSSARRIDIAASSRRRWRRRRQEDRRHRSSSPFSRGAHAKLREQVDKLISRAPRASCSTCAATAAACSRRARSCRASSSKKGLIVSTNGPQRARAEAGRTGDAIAAQPADGRARGQRHRERVRDRHRRAARPQPRDRGGRANVRQGRLPGGRAAAERRRAGADRRATTCRTARTSSGHGIDPPVKAKDNPKTQARRGAAGRAAAPC